MFEEVYFVT